MKRQELEATGIVGVSVSFNHSELIALKGFANQLKDLESDADNKYRYNEKVKPLVESVLVFLNNIVGNDVVSVEEAYAGLFIAPAAVSPVYAEE